MKIFYFFLISFLLLGCKKKGYEPEIININNSKISARENISNIIDTIKIIPLIENSKEHFASVFKVIICNNRYVVYDRLNTNKILLFNEDGTFNKVVCKVGQDDKNPLNMTDMWLNSNNELEVYDYAQMKVLRFDKNFEFAASIKSENLNHFVSFCHFKNSFIGYANYSDYNTPFKGKMYSIAYLDTSLDIIKTNLHFDKKFQGVLWSIYNQHFTNYNDSIRFIKSYDNNVYHIDDKEIFIRYKINYEVNNLPENVNDIIDKNLALFKNRIVPPNTKASIFKSFSCMRSPWIENDKYIFINSKDTMGYLGTSFISVYNKQSKNEMFSTRKLEETIKYKMQLPTFLQFDQTNDEFIAIVPSTELEKLCFMDSPVRNVISQNPYQFYLLKIKLK
jgi:hypothetical protein